MAINPIVYTERVVRGFLKYQLSAYPFADPRLHSQMRDLLRLDRVRSTPLLKGHSSIWPGATWRTTGSLITGRSVPKAASRGTRRLPTVQKLTSGPSIT